MQRLLVDAGVGAGMRVLDLGCGAGEVTRLIAKLVGNDGHVVGVDRQDRVIAKATAQVQHAGLSNITFLEQDLCEPLPASRPYDAAVARRVLMYLADPSVVVRAVADVLRPGGIVVVQEIDSTMTPARTTPLPLHDQVNDWIWSTISAEGANVRMGIELPLLLEQCGLTLEHVRAEAEIEGHTSSMATIVRAILPRILHHTDVAEAEIDVDTLERRLANERADAGSVYIPNMSFGVWASKP